MHTAVYPRIFFHELFVSPPPVCHYSIETRSNPPLVAHINFLQTARWALGDFGIGAVHGLTTCIKGARQACSLLTHLAVAHSPTLPALSKPASAKASNTIFSFTLSYARICWHITREPDRGRGSVLPDTCDMSFGDPTRRNKTLVHLDSRRASSRGREDVKAVPPSTPRGKKEKARDLTPKTQHELRRSSAPSPRLFIGPSEQRSPGARSPKPELRKSLPWWIIVNKCLI